MGNLLLNDVVQESQALQTRPWGPTIAVGFSELIVRFNLQFSVNNYLVTRLLIGMDLELFSFKFTSSLYPPKVRGFSQLASYVTSRAIFPANMWRE